MLAACQEIWMFWMPCCIQWFQWPESEPRKGLNVNIAAAMASKDSDKQAILNALAFPRAGTKILQQEAQATHERTLLLFELWSLFLLFLLDFYLLIQCTSRPVDPVSPRVVHWGYEAVGRALAGHFALANWPLAAVLLVKSTWSKKSLLSLFDASFCGLHVAVSWVRRHPQLRFSSVANGLDTSRWGPRSGSWTGHKNSTELGQFTQRICNCIELGNFHQFSTDFLRFIRFLSV